MAVWNWRAVNSRLAHGELSVTSALLHRINMAFLLCFAGLCSSGNTTASPIADIDTNMDAFYAGSNDSVVQQYYDHACTIAPDDKLLADRIESLISNGAKLIKYDVTFPDYLLEPFIHNSSYIYKPNMWERVVGEHGKTLLSLAFNYDILSLRMLTFGVEDVKVRFKDTPRNCFGALDMSTQNYVIRRALLNNFQDMAVLEESKYSVTENYVCQKLIADDNGYADFSFKCCRFSDLVNGTITCPPSEVQEDKWIKLLYILILLLKIGFLLLGPLVIQKWIYHQSIRKANYTVKAPETLRKTLVVKKIRTPDSSNTNTVEALKDYPGQFAHFRRIVKAIPSSEVVPVNISQLHLQVDHKLLIDEKSVPTGLMYFLWTNVFQCGIMKYEPFLSCCRESIVGSWDTRFLWLKLYPGGSQCNKGCRKYFSYGHVTNLLGILILIAAVATPYAVRVAIYYMYEEPEIQLRKEAIAAVGLKERIGENLFHYLTPSHTLCMILYICFFSSFIVLAFYKRTHNEDFEEIVLGSLQDLRSISRMECLRLVVSHLLLPFEKFGLCGGVLIGAIYWTFSMPLCVITIVWYCVPTLYLTGRLMIQSRPMFVKYSGVPYVPKQRKASGKNPWSLGSLSLGITSIETCMMLNNISPNNRRDPIPEDNSRLCDTQCSVKSLMAYFSKLVIGLMCIIWLFCVLIIYAECFGFVIEAFVMTLMGAVVNAGSAANYIMVGFWAITYSVSCYNDCYQRYVNLNAKVFAFVNDKLNDQIKYLKWLREEKQHYTAFKYFSREDLEQERKMEIANDLESENEVNAVLGKTIVERSRDDESQFEDSIEYINGKLHWRVSHLVLFIDRKDVPRIPRRLFEEVCYIDAPGCPGPVYKGLMQATKKFMYMVFFLLFVAVVVMAFGNMYNVSTTNQLLVTLAGGFVPFVIRFVLSPTNTGLNLNTLMFEGKLHDIIKTFKECWPVHDLTFTLDSNVEQDIPPPSGGDNQPQPPPLPPHPPPALGGIAGQAVALGGGAANAGQEPTNLKRALSRQVDLLITIRDDDPEEPADNLRSQPGSLGSLTSDPRMTSAAVTAANNQDVIVHSPVRTQSLHYPMLISHPLATAHYPPPHSPPPIPSLESIPMSSLNRSSDVNVATGATAAESKSSSAPAAASHVTSTLYEDVIRERDEESADDDDGDEAGRYQRSKSNVSLGDVVAHIECRARLDLDGEEVSPAAARGDVTPSTSPHSHRKSTASPTSEDRNKRRLSTSSDELTSVLHHDAGRNRANRRDAQSPDELAKINPNA